MFEIFCDMDGVLTNFVKAALDLNPDLLKIYDNNHDEAWKIVLAEGTKFWSEMEWIEGGKELWNYILPYKPTILSAAAKRFRMEIIEGGKKQWLDREVGEEFARTGIIVNSAEFKQRYSGKNKILIDDAAINIKQWTEKGGIGIQHVNTIQTLKILDGYLKK